MEKDLQSNVSTIKEVRNAFQSQITKQKGKMPLWRPGYKWEQSKLKGTWRAGTNWIYLAQTRVKWRALVKTEVNLSLPYKMEISLPAEQLSDYQEGA